MVQHDFYGETRILGVFVIELERRLDERGLRQTMVRR
jgi:hypothetical protein